MITNIYWIIAILVMVVLLINGIYMLVTNIKNNKEYKKHTAYINEQMQKLIKKDFEEIEDSLESMKAQVKETQHKFKVGDKVIGNEKATEEYNITKEGWIGTVVETTDNGFTADGFMWLDYECFDLYEEREEK